MDKILRNGVDLKGFNGDAHFFEDVTAPAKVRQYLDSFQETDKLKGMKLLLAMLSKGKDIPEFFPDVVKNVVVKSIEVKKMVYIYLVHYADFDANCREIALLSINSFQKDMAGANPLIRGLALRVMTSIRVQDIIQIQLLAVRKCATDTSPYVRKCAANAVPKIYSMDPEQIEHLKQIIELLLKDISTMVLGSAVAAFNEVCPADYGLLHRNHRKLCHLLADMDEWTQVSVLEVLTRYIRNQFTDPAPGIATAVKLQAKQRSSAAVQGRMSTVRRRVVKKAFYSDEEDQSEEEAVELPDVNTNKAPTDVLINGDFDVEGDLDPDHRLVLKSSLPLLKSRNSGVVLAVCTLHYYCGSHGASATQQIAKALVRVLRNRREVQFVVLTCINAMARDRPAMFKPYLSDFFVKATDPVFNRLLKLDILASLSCTENTQIILRELQTYVKDGHEAFVCSAVRVVGQLADGDPAVAGNCMEGIMHLLLCTKNASIIRECVVVLRQLLQQNVSSPSSVKILRQLAKLLIIEGGMEEPTARSSIVWLVGEFHHALSDVSPDILRILAAGFVQECTETKTQILNLAVKLSVHLPDDEGVQLLMTYVLEMARYDLDTDLRDRSRFMTAIMGLAPSNEGDVDAPSVDEDALSELNEHAKAIMLAPKLPPVTLLGSVDVEGIPNFTMGTLSSIVGHNAMGYEPLQPWPEVQPDPTIRDSVQPSRSEGSLQYGEGQHLGSGFPNGGVPPRRRSSSSSSSGAEGDRLDNFYGDHRKDSGRRRSHSRSSSSSGSSGSSGSSSSYSSSGSENEISASESDSEGSSSDQDSTSGSASGSESSSSAESSAYRSSVHTRGGSSSKPSPRGSKMPASPFSSSGALQSLNRSQVDYKGSHAQPQGHAHTTPAATTTATTTTQMGQKNVVSKQGVRKVSGGRVKKDALCDTLVPAKVERVELSGSESDLVGLSRELSAGSSSDGMALLHDAALDISAPHSVAAFSTDLLMPAQQHQQQQQQQQLMRDPGVALGAGVGSMTPSFISSPKNMDSSANIVSLSSGYTGLGAAGQQVGMGRPSAMLGGPTHSTAEIPGSSYNNNNNNNGGLMGNQRMMMQTPLALTQHASAADGTGNGAGSMGSAAGVQGGAQNVMFHSLPPIAEGEYLSHSKVMLRPEMGGGLSVAICFRYGVPAVTFNGAFSTYIVLRNVGDQLLRRIKVFFPVDVRRTPTIPEVSMLSPGQEAWLPVEMVLLGMSGKTIKVDVRCDKGSFAGTLLIQDWEALHPIQMSSVDFEVTRARLGGLGEVCRTQPTASLWPNERFSRTELSTHITERVRSALNVYPVPGANQHVLMFAGMARKGQSEHKLLITMETTNPQVVSFRLNCEDPVLCNALGDIFFKMISS